MFGAFRADISTRTREHFMILGDVNASKGKILTSMEEHGLVDTCGCASRLRGVENT